jgi:hypothetical protein
MNRDYPLAPSPNMQDRQSDSTKQKYPSLKEKVDIAKKLYKENPSKVFSDAVKRAEKNLTDSISKAKTNR